MAVAECFPKAGLYAMSIESLANPVQPLGNARGPVRGADVASVAKNCGNGAATIPTALSLTLHGADEYDWDVAGDVPRPCSQVGHRYRRRHESLFINELGCGNTIAIGNHT